MGKPRGNPGHLAGGLVLQPIGKIVEDVGHGLCGGPGPDTARKVGNQVSRHSQQPGHIGSRVSGPDHHIVGTKIHNPPGGHIGQRPAMVHRAGDHGRCRPQQLQHCFPVHPGTHRGKINCFPLDGHFVEDVPHPLERPHREHIPGDHPPGRPNHFRIAYDVGQHLTFQGPCVGNRQPVNGGGGVVSLVVE